MSETLRTHHLPPSVLHQEKAGRPHDRVRFGKKEEELRQLFLLQEEANRALGRTFDPDDMLRRSYNPVVDRWHVERFRRVSDNESLEAYKLELRENMRTNLMERLHTVESYGEYAIFGDQLVSKDFPGRSFFDVLERGVEYRRRLGSPEPEREGELGELSGWRKINASMTDPDAKIGTTIYSLSPHGLAENTAFDGWFVDTLTLRENLKKEKYVERIRTGVNWDYAKYSEIALHANPSYFDNYDGRPMDAWFLSHPISVHIQLDKKGFSKLSTEEILHNYKLKRLLTNYEQNIYSENINWLETAVAFNAVLNYLDDLKNDVIHDRYSNIRINDLEEAVFLKGVQDLGRRQVQVVGGGGCPANKGEDLSGVFGSSGINMGVDIFSNSVAKFGLEKEGCGCENKSDNHYHCPKCKMKYDDETNASAENRTKVCKKDGCGFKFGC